MEVRVQALVWLLVGCLATSALCAPVEWPSDVQKGLRKLGPAPKPPVFPEQYEVKYRFSMPYTLAYQHSPLAYDVHLWYDGVKGLQRIDTLGGVDSTYVFKAATYSVVPTINKKTCYYSWNRREEESVSTTLGRKGIPVDFSDWTYGGQTTYKGREASVWSLYVKEYERVMYYYFYVSTDGHPLLLTAMGQDWYSGSHFDQYISEFDYDSWKPGPIAPEVFKLPQECGDKAVKVENGNMGSSAIRMQMLIPKFYRGDAEYDSHAIRHGRFHSSPAEYYKRLGMFTSNKAMITEHNANPSKTYTLGLNKFSDWSDEEFKAAMLGRKGDREAVDRLRANAPRHVSKHHSLPASFDWEGTILGGIVKDQASCGSCWSFSAVGTMEAAWYKATGQSLDFSEQQIVDCAWDYGVYGCDGGYAESAITYVSENGGVMTENNYMYLGQDDWCRFNTTEQKEGASGFFSGFTVIPYKDVHALKEAIYTKGPVAVALDAANPHFRFYTGGIYNSCNPKYVDLDHAVTMVGYGEENGVKYYKIRNSWSKYWGNEGYIKIAQDNDCGITSEAVYANVDEEKAREARGGF